MKIYSKRQSLYLQSNNTKYSLNFGLTFTKAPGSEELLMRIWLSNCCTMFFGVTRHPSCSDSMAALPTPPLLGTWAGSILSSECAAIITALCRVDLGPSGKYPGAVQLG